MGFGVFQQLNKYRGRILRSFSYAIKNSNNSKGAKYVITRKNYRPYLSGKQ